MAEPDARGADAPRNEAALRRAGTMRTAISASRRAKSSSRLVSASSIAMPGRSAWKRGEDRRQHLAADDVARGHPHDAAVGRRLARGGARQRRRGRRHRFGVRRQGERRRRRRKAAGERANNADPSAASSASMWRPTVGWLRPSRRAAPDRLPSRATSTKVRSSSQFGGRRAAIHYRIAARQKYAISFIDR